MVIELKVGGSWSQHFTLYSMYSMQCAAVKGAPQCFTCFQRWNKIKLQILRGKAQQAFFLVKFKLWSEPEDTDPHYKTEMSVTFCQKLDCLLASSFSFTSFC